MGSELHGCCFPGMLLGLSTGGPLEQANPFDRGVLLLAELFFPLGNGPGTEARQICASCLVQDLCLAYSVIADEAFGVWGGLDRQERHALRRLMQRRGELPPSNAGSAA